MDSQQPGLKEMQDRLGKLEKQNREIKRIGTVSLIVLVSLVVLGQASAAQGPDAKAEAVVNCSALLVPEPLTPFGFAKATLISLRYARTAAEQIDSLKKMDSDDPLKLLTGMMQVIKTSTNDFICAKRSIEPFAKTQSANDSADARIKAAEDIRASEKKAVDALAVICDAHINLNQRMIELLKKQANGGIDQSELADQLSTLVVERDQRWDAFTTLAYLQALLTLQALPDLTRPDPVHPERAAHWLVITKAQKQTLLDSVDTLKKDAPADSWPVQIAQLYLSFFNDSWKCSDEPY